MAKAKKSKTKKNSKVKKVKRTVANKTAKAKSSNTKRVKNKPAAAASAKAGSTRTRPATPAPLYRIHLERPGLSGRDEFEIVAEFVEFIRPGITGFGQVRIRRPNRAEELISVGGSDYLLVRITAPNGREGVMAYADGTVTVTAIK